MPDYEADFPDMKGPAYILFGNSGGEFAFGCLTGAIHGTKAAMKPTSSRNLGVLLQQPASGKIEYQIGMCALYEGCALPA
jgi:hypothetical protein